MYRFQGTHRSNGIYCEPDNTHHHFSPPHMTKKMTKMRAHQYHGSRANSRPQPHRTDPGMDSDIDSSSEVSDGTYPDSEGHGMSLQTRMNISQNGGVSPPEPAPSDLPMRMNGAIRTLKSTYSGGVDMDGDSEHSGYHIQPGSGVYLPQEYHMSSPYQPKPPLPMGASLATAKKLFQSDNLPNETADSNSTQSTLPSQARLIGGLGGPPASNPMLIGIPSAPVILPVFPNSTPHSGQVTGTGGVVPSSRSLPRNQYSPSRFTLQKDCRVSDRCSWKCVSVALILICVALISILIYFAAIMGNCSRYPGTGCIVVEDAKVMARGDKHFPSVGMIDLTSISPKSNEDMVSPTSLVPEVTSKQFGEFNDGLAPAEVIWGQVLTRRIEPYSYWTLEMNVRESAHVSVNLSVPWGTNWALMFRKNALPSVTQHDLMKVVKNGRIEHRNKRRHVRSVSTYNAEDNSTLTPTSLLAHHRERRESDPSIIVISEYLDAGKWFLRLFNDDLSPRRVRLITSVDPKAEIRCPMQCSGNGNCVYGKCHCFDGFTGLDCSTSICPVLCSNHGRYGGGVCICESGWKGSECDVPESECEIGNCQGNGDCVNGRCICRKGWTGEFCDQPECAPTCSLHGTCVQGKCLCQTGWTGHSCNFPESLLAKCIPDCSTRGVFDAESRSCICQKPYGGPECLEVVCEKECGRNGFCNDKGECQCQMGWNGDNCESLICDVRCQDHGQCKNGTCICQQGWNGKYCTLDGCPNSCSRHGSCIMQDGVYSCKCNNGWAGLNCSVPLETNCSDDVDNDEDGMADCSDSECCESPACKEHLMCMTANDPVEVLLRKQPPSVTSSFYQRVKFLIEEESVQSYAQKDEYWERRVSVIRGQVLSSDGLGIVGIRVSVDKTQKLGFTLTRKGGWFDMLVNGGGSVTLQFQRVPFRQLTRTVFVPWNEIVVLDPPVVLETLSEHGERGYTVQNKRGFSSYDTIGGSHLRDQSFEESRQSQTPCLQHDLDILKPTIVSSWFPPMVGASPQKTLIFGETQILQESIVIPGSDVHLLYHSSQSPGYLTTVLMQLTGEKIPEGLVLVHLKITIEGELYRKTFEADPNITYTFGWRKRNVYQQKVYGLASARVAIGYEYSNCSKPVWTVQSVTLKGFDVDIADVGGWNLNIHHHYNFHEGILQKGDGSEVHLKEMPRLVTTLMGKKGQQRSLLCEPCENLLLSPIALTTGPDGSLYVGDFNLIRRITPENRTYTLLQLSATKVSHQYYMTISPADGHLYISDPEKYQVLRVNSMGEVEDPRVNWSPVVGSGLKCVPGDPENCGDGFPAKLARLNHPKGLALTSGGSIYIADGPNIRYVDSFGVIHTIVGRQSHWSMRTSMVKTADFESCRIMREDASKVQLHWPTNLALNLVENKLLLIDEGNLFQITEDNQVERFLKCETSGKVVRPILDLAFSPKGQLYFVTEDSVLFTVKSKGQALMVLTDKVPPYQQMHKGKGERQRNNLDSSSISALSIGADGTIYVADQANLELKQVTHFIPTPNKNGDYEVVFPATGEMYIFNRYGQHILTKDLKSGKVLYSFLYTKNTSYGKLNKISDSAEHKLVFMRDYNSVVSTIENTQGKKCSLKINHQGRLVHFQVMENSDVRLEYSDDGLLLAKTTSAGLGSMYSYDSAGRIRRVIDETGVITSFGYKLNGDAIEVQVYDSSKIGLTRYKILKSEEVDQVTITQLMTETATALTSQKVIKTDATNLSYSLVSETGNEMIGKCWGVYPLLSRAMPVDGSLMRPPSHQYMYDMESTGLGNKQEWRFGVIGESINPILDRQMWVNDTKILTLEFDQTLSREIVYNRAKDSIFSIQYDSTGLPLYFIPSPNQGLASYQMNVTYDRFNRVENWKWGQRCGQQITYGRNGFASEIKNLDGGLIRSVTYDEADHPSKIVLQSGRTFTFQYDIHGGLKSMETPKNTRHSFTFQHSVSFTKLIYQPPGYTSVKNSFVKYLNSFGLLQSVWLPTESGRVFYEYDFLRRPIYTLYSEGKIRYKYKSRQVTISCTENTKFESTTHIYTNAMSKVTQEKQEFGPKLGLVSAKFVYEYDTNFRPVLIKSRVGGNVLPDFPFAYNGETGMLDQLGNFRIARSNINNNESSIFDGVAVFSRLKDGYGLPLRYTLTIQAMEVFRLDYLYDSKSHRVQQLSMTTKSNGASDQTYAPVKNFTYDVDGQLIMVESVEPWRFEYDPNGNLRTLSYRGNTIPLEHNQEDRIVRFGDGAYKYDNAGRIVQNAREELFMYNSLGHLKRAWKRGQFDVEYFYDVEGRLVARKDNYGNATQFFYGDVRFKNAVTLIYSPKENRVIQYVYDDSQRLIFFQVNRAEKFYVASDHCGTPILVFNQYGQIVREMSRSPYGYIIYDSDPTFYLPVDFCGGIFDRPTRLVHMKGGRVYDPLIGQFLMPDWQNVLGQLNTPEKIHLYRLNGNDPMNHVDPAPAFDHQSWLKHMGYNLESLSPQLYPSNIGLAGSPRQLVISGLESRVMEKVFTESLLLTIPKSAVTKSTLIPDPAALISEIDPPLGKNILLSRTADGKAMISCPFCTSNRIYRDVFTQILNGSEFLSFVAHSPSQDVFHFAKKELWKASDDLAELKRLGGQVNVAVHDRASENQMMDLKIHMSGAMLSVKYGLNGSAEENRLVHHAKSVASQKAWANLKDYIRAGYPIPEFTSAEKEEILKNGHLTTHHAEFTHNPDEFPIFADDPLNVRIVKKTKSQRNRSSNNNHH